MSSLPSWSSDSSIPYVAVVPKSTDSIEIFSPELVATYFWKLSNQLQLDYYYLLGNGHPASLDPNYSQSWDARADIEVDLEMLKRTLTLANIG